MENKSQLKDYFERICSLENEKKAVQEYIKEAYKEAKNDGFEPIIMKEVLRLYKMDDHQRNEYNELVKVYGNVLENNIHIE